MLREGAGYGEGVAEPAQIFTILLTNGTKIMVAGKQAEIEDLFLGGDQPELARVEDTQGHLHLVNRSQVVEIRDQGPALPHA